MKFIKSAKLIVGVSIAMMLTLKLMSMVLNAVLNEQDEAARPTEATVAAHCEGGEVEACKALREGL